MNPTRQLAKSLRFSFGFYIMVNMKPESHGFKCQNQDPGHDRRESFRRWGGGDNLARMIVLSQSTAHANIIIEG